jgi:hypothetical protein
MVPVPLGRLLAPEDLFLPAVLVHLWDPAVLPFLELPSRQLLHL